MLRDLLLVIGYLINHLWFVHRLIVCHLLCSDMNCRSYSSLTLFEINSPLLLTCDVIDWQVSESAMLRDQPLLIIHVWCALKLIVPHCWPVIWSICISQSNYPDCLSLNNLWFTLKLIVPHCWPVIWSICISQSNYPDCLPLIWTEIIVLNVITSDWLIVSMPTASYA